MKKNSYFLLATLLLIANEAYAEQEDWYTYWSIGVASHSHPEEIDQLFDSIEDESGSIFRIPRLENAFDLLGFYWPVQNNSIAGFVINLSRDSVSSLGSTISVSTTLVGLSYIRFKGKEPGDGLYIRADVGRADVDVSHVEVFKKSISTSTSESGVGYLLGVGYGLPLSAKSRLLFGLNLTNRKVGQGNFKSSQFTVGVLW